MMVRWYQCCVFPPLSLPSFCINVAPAGGFESPRVFSAEIHSFVVSLASLGVCLLSDAMKKKEAERRFQHRRKCKQNRIREKWDWASEYMKKKSVSFDYISFFFTWVERSEIPRGVNKYVSICLKFSTRCSQRERRKTVSAKNERESEAKYKKKRSSDNVGSTQQLRGLNKSDYRRRNTPCYVCSGFYSKDFFSLKKEKPITHLVSPFVREWNVVACI